MTTLTVPLALTTEEALVAMVLLLLLALRGGVLLRGRSTWTGTVVAAGTGLLGGDTSDDLSSFGFPTGLVATVPRAALAAAAAMVIGWFFT